MRAGGAPGGVTASLELQPLNDSRWMRPPPAAQPDGVDLGGAVPLGPALQPPLDQRLTGCRLMEV